MAAKRTKKTKAPAPKKKAAPKKKTAPAKKSVAKAKKTVAPKKLARKKNPRDLFRALVTALLRAALPESTVRRESGEFALRVQLPGGQQSIVYLASLFAETREMSPEDRAQFLDARLRALLTPQSTDDFSEVRARLVPTLRATTFGMHVQLANRGGTDTLLGRPFVPFVDLRVAIDDEQSLRYATAANLAKWGIDHDAAIAHALENASELLSRPSPYDDSDGPMFHVAEDDDYQSSRLAMPGMLASFVGEVDGRPLAIIPERAQIFIAGDARPSMVERLCEMAEREWSISTRAISPAVYTVDEAGRVVPYVRKGNDALARKVMLGHVRLALREYAEQKEVLDKLHERDNVDVFVATLNGFLRADGRPITWCLWGENIESLLPHAELVTLDGGEGETRWSFHVPFAEVAALMGWADEPGFSPSRVRPSAWPNKKQLAKLRKSAVDFDDLV